MGRDDSLEPRAYGTHSLRRTKVAMLYKKTGNLRACQLLLGHRKLESTVRYLSIKVDNALELSQQLTYEGTRCPPAGKRTSPLSLTGGKLSSAPGRRVDGRGWAGKLTRPGSRASGRCP